MTERKIRAFIAVPLPEEVQAGLRRLQGELRRRLPETTRWARPEGSHLTLAFLGDIAEDSLEKIGEVMLSVSDSRSACTLSVCGVGAFPAASRARVLWAGVIAVEPLLSLQAALTAGLSTLGLAPEARPFHPHLTLGRLRTGYDVRPLLHDFSSFAAGPLPLERIILYQSRLLPQGALHTLRVVATLRPPTL